LDFLKCFIAAFKYETNTGYGPSFGTIYKKNGILQRREDELAELATTTAAATATTTQTLSPK